MLLLHLFYSAGEGEEKERGRRERSLEMVSLQAGYSFGTLCYMIVYSKCKFCQHELYYVSRCYSSEITHTCNVDFLLLL